MAQRSGRTIELVLPKRHLVAEACLFEQEAPRVCQALWDMLPLQLETIHAMVSGCELYVVFPWPQPPPPQENFTMCTDAGDLFFYYSPWYSEGAAPSGEIAIFYDRDAIPMGSQGPMAGTLVGSIVVNRAEFAAACEVIWREGAETLVIRRAGEAQ